MPKIEKKTLRFRFQFLSTDWIWLVNEVALRHFRWRNNKISVPIKLNYKYQTKISLELDHDRLNNSI